MVEPDSQDWVWGLKLKAFGIAGQERLLEAPGSTHAEGCRVVYEWNEQLEEWFVNDVSGLEHGYTVHERPGNESAGIIALSDTEPLRFHIALCGDLTPRLNSDLRGIRFLKPDGATALTYLGLKAFDADGTELEARYRLVGDMLVLEVDEQEARYPLTIDPIVQQAYLKASNTDPNDEFGESVSISGDTVAVGAPSEDSDATGINGDQSNANAVNSGAVYVFVRNSSGWQQEAYVKASNTDALDRFGEGVALSGDTLVVGAPAESSNVQDSGATYVFTRSAGTWSQETFLKAGTPIFNGLFGGFLAIDGNNLVVAEPRAIVNGLPSAGVVYVFERDAQGWREQAVLQASNPGFQTRFGDGLDISGNRIVVGAPFENSDAIGVNGNQGGNGALRSGAAYIFEKLGGIWQQTAYLKASNTNAGDEFGRYVGISGDTVIVGAELEDSSSPGVNGAQANNMLNASGAAYVYEFESGSWIFDSYLKASNPRAGDLFGRAVDVEGNTLVVGAFIEDGPSVGVNGNTMSDVAVNGSGAVYVFTRDEGQWRQSSYLKASNAGAGDVFGLELELSANTLIVGAKWEDSSSTGVNGDPSLNDAKDAGAAYIFDLASPCGVERYGEYKGANQLDLYSFELPIAGASFQLVVSDLGGSGTAFLLFSASPLHAPFRGGTLFVNLEQNLYVPGALFPVPIVAGSGQISISLPPGTEGLIGYAQGFAIDPLQPGGLAFTNGLRIQICP